jgi:hypothetical protein
MRLALSMQLVSMALSSTFAELERRLYADSGRKRRRKNAAPRCRRCGKHRTFVPWIDFHQRQNNDAAAIDTSRPQNRYLQHGEGQVWDQCTLAESDFEKGFPCLDLNKRSLDRGSQNKLAGAIINITS